MKRAMLLYLALMVAVPAAADTPDRESLVGVWRASLRADPDTLRFEPIGDRRYSYATAAFPFDGTIEIAEVVIDDRGAEMPFGVVTGHVVVELVGVEDEFRRRHATSLALWETENTFMWDENEERWTTSAEWTSSLQLRYGGWWSALGSGLFWIAVLGVFLLLAWLFTRRAQGQMKRAMAQQEHALEQQERSMRMQEEGLELTREGNRLLAALLERLEERDEP